MLQQLEIRNVALIDNISIEFGEGLNILTGETGAGKSIIIDSINAIIGERISKDLIRTGCEKASIEAVFTVDIEKILDILQNAGIDPESDGTIIISREYSLSGRNICRINGKLVTVSTLKEIGERIIDIHGQYDNQSLLKPENQLELLDSFGRESIQAIKQEYSKMLSRYKAVKARLKELAGNEDEKERRIDVIRYQIDEIRKAKLNIGEDEELKKRHLLVSNSERILKSLMAAYDMLLEGSGIRNSALDFLNMAIAEVSAIARIDGKYEELADRLKDLSYQLHDITEDIRKEKEELEYDPFLLEQLEERIDLISRLKKKYGGTIEDILEYCGKIEKELNEIEKSSEMIEALQNEAKEIENQLYDLAVKLHAERINAAKVLEEEIGRELNDLEMKNVCFKADIEFYSGSGINEEPPFMKNGMDKLEFLISPNVGEPLKPLAKIASGGEMSRIMLAIKTILASVDSMPTIIFDEIDMGVSGKVSQRIGEKLSYISKNRQVICVTHFAQIACMADNHYIIEKITENERTVTRVRKLKGDQIKNEIARIIGGAVISDITIRHAEEMLNTARRYKVIQY